MHIAQYYADSPATREKIIALAELLGCEYRTVENIIAVQVDDAEALAKLKRSECLPCAVEAGAG
jgi:hypothetical protein